MSLLTEEVSAGKPRRTRPYDGDSRGLTVHMNGDIQGLRLFTLFTRNGAFHAVAFGERAFQSPDGNRLINITPAAFTLTRMRAHMGAHRSHRIRGARDIVAAAVLALCDCPDVGAGIGPNRTARATGDQIQKILRCGQNCVIG